MWRRALLAAAALSYLICVLVMSGMQKEDLDLTMLRKLQRYNVNIDDINNDRIKQQCLSRSNSFTTGELKDQIKESYVSTTEYKTEINTKEPLSSARLNLDTVLSYLKMQKDSDGNLDKATKTTIASTTTTTTTATITTEKTTDRPQEIVISTTERIKNPTISKIDMDIIRRYIQLETQDKSFYKQHDNLETTKHYTAIDLKTNEGISNEADAAFINKVVKDYVFKKLKPSTTTERTTTKHTIDIQNIYKQIDKIIAKQSHVVDDEKEIVKIKPAKIERNEEIDMNPIKLMSQTKPYSPENRLIESFYKFLTEMNQFQNNLPQPLLIGINSDKELITDNTQTTELLEPPYKKKQEKHNESTTNKSKSDIDLNQKTLSPNLVKEIAETVKEVIIKDLRKELANINLKTTHTTAPITPTTPKTTTETSPTTTPNSTMQEKDMIIMDKFMNLYKEIKSLKQATFSLRINNKTVDELNPPNEAPVQSAMVVPTVKKFYSPEIQSMSSVGKINPYYSNYNSYLPRKEIDRQPLTIQTNAIEIQPLAIPVSKPESLVRQNIVVHPIHRFQGTEELYVRHSGRGGYTHSDSDIPVRYRNRTYSYTPLKGYDGYNSARYSAYHLKEPEQRDDIIRFKIRENGNTGPDTDYYERINFGSDHNSGNGNGGNGYRYGGNGNGNGANGYVTGGNGNGNSGNGYSSGGNGNGNGANGYVNGGNGNGNGGNGYSSGGNGNGNGVYSNGNGVYDYGNGANNNGNNGNGHGNGNGGSGNGGNRGFFINRNIPKFHERLERIDMTGKREYRADFPSRHQLSLLDMKKGSSYDDTHFKNFIKTQLKVTDMLERILATRPKTNTPRSVEAV